MDNSLGLFMSFNKAPAFQRGDAPTLKAFNKASKENAGVPIGGFVSSFVLKDQVPSAHTLTPSRHCVCILHL